jgi:hypothetical protein
MPLSIKQAKRAVAAEAARIMATEGQRNYLAAKHKAAARLGYSGALALPSNKDVETELKSYQNLYGGIERQEHLQRLREAALEAMDFLAPFQPKLVGQVLDGTADQHSRVSLHVFSEIPDEIGLFLSENGIPFRQESRRIRWHTGKFRDLALLITEAGEITIELCLYSNKDLRQPPPSPVDGRPQKRAGRREVHLLQLQTSPPAI